MRIETIGDAMLYLSDCLEVVPTLEAGSIDAIITDIPYGTTACKWDTIIPFDDLWRIVKHALKPRGAFVTTASQPFTSALVMSNPGWFRDEIIWEKSKPVGFLDANRKPLNSHENVIIFSESGGITYNPQKWQIPPLYWDRRKTFTVIRDDTNVYGKRLPKSKRKDDGSRYPLSVLFVESEWKNGMHTTQKPVALYEYLIRTYTNPGELVLDITMGSGTTGVAALKTGRKFIGVELDEGYFDIACRRIEAENRQLKMF